MNQEITAIMPAQYACTCQAAIPLLELVPGVVVCGWCGKTWDSTGKPTPRPAVDTPWREAWRELVNREEQK